MADRWKQWKQRETLYLGAPKITANGDCSHEIKRPLLLGRKVMTNQDSMLKSRDITLSTKVRLVKSIFLPVVMTWELDYKESWAPKNWCFWTVVLEKTLESPLDCKEIQTVHPKGDQSWVFIGRTDAEAETPILCPPDAKSWLIWKDSDAGRDWGQEEKGMTEDKMVGWHHWLNGHRFGWTPGVGDGQGGLACYSSWGRKELDMTERLNWTVSPYICHEVMGSHAMSLISWMLNFKPTFLLSSFTFIKRLFSSFFAFCPKGGAVIWGYWYFSQQSWFQFVVHPAQHFSWCTLHIS